MVPKSGSRLPVSLALTDSAFARAIGEALQSELGASHRAAKTIMAWTPVSDRTAREWLNGRSGPRGRHLVQLAANCRAVLAVLLRLSGHEEVALVIDLAAVESSLEVILAAARRLRTQGS